MYFNVFTQSERPRKKSNIIFNFMCVCEFELMEFMLGGWFGLDVMIDRRSWMLLYKYIEYIW